MAYEIKLIDDFVNECIQSGKDISYENFSSINESLADNMISRDLFESYLRYKDISGTGMITLLEFEKIKSFSEFIDSKNSTIEEESDDEFNEDEDDDGDDDDDDDDDDEDEGFELETNVDSETASEIEDKINKMGEPEIKSEEEDEKFAAENRRADFSLREYSISEEQELINTDEANRIIESILFSLNEDFTDNIKASIISPVKFIKIKNSLKQWAKFKLDNAAIEMDAVRKKEATKNDPQGIDKEKLDKATKAKKDALKGKMDAIDDKLKELATNDALKAFVRLGKAKASLEANKKLLKIAQQEENDALKLKLKDEIENQEDAITDIYDELKKYTDKGGDEENETEEQGTDKQSSSKSVKNKSNDSDKDQDKKPDTGEKNKDEEQGNDKQPSTKSDEDKADNSVKDQDKKSDTAEKKKDEENNNSSLNKS